MGNCVCRGSSSARSELRPSTVHISYPWIGRIATTHLGALSLGLSGRNIDFYAGLVVHPDGCFCSVSALPVSHYWAALGMRPPMPLVAFPQPNGRRCGHAGSSRKESNRVDRGDGSQVAPAVSGGGHPSWGNGVADSTGFV